MKTVLTIASIAAVFFGLTLIFGMLFAVGPNQSATVVECLKVGLFVSVPFAGVMYLTRPQSNTNKGE